MKLKLITEESAPDLSVKVTQDDNGSIEIEANEWSLATIFINDDGKLVMERSTGIDDDLISTDKSGRVTLEDE